MMGLIALVAVVVAVAVAVKMRRERDAARAEWGAQVAETYAARVETENVRVNLTEALARMRDERDAALDTDKWMPLSLREVSALAKTGHSPCGSAGYTQVHGEHRICACVLDRMAGDSRYGMSGGIPVKRMTKQEVELARMEASRC